MVLPVDLGPVQQMLRLTKLAGGTYSEERLDNFSFVPMLEGKNGR